MNAHVTCEQKVRFDPLGIQLPSIVQRTRTSDHWDKKENYFGTYHTDTKDTRTVPKLRSAVKAVVTGSSTFSGYKCKRDSRTFDEDKNSLV